MSRQPITVLISGAGGAGYPLVFKALRASQRYDVRIVAAEVNPLAGNLYRDEWVDAAYCVPTVGSPDYLQRMLTIVEREGVGFWLSAVDEELPVIARNRDALATRGCRVVLPDDAALDAAFDKRATNDAVRNIAAFPRTIYPAANADIAAIFDELGPEVVIKACRTRGNRLNYTVADPDELRLRIAQFHTRGIDFMCQSRILGDEYNVSLLADADGEIVYAAARQKVDPPRTRPNTFAGLIRRDAELEADAVAIVRAMKLYPGTSNVEFIKPPGGRGLMIDVNGGRHAAQDYNLVASGINIPELLLDMAHGHSIASVPSELIRDGMITLKFVDEYTIDIGDILRRCGEAQQDDNLSGLWQALQRPERETSAQ